MIAVPTAQAAPARRMAIAGAALEVSSMKVMQNRLGMVGEPYEQGRPGRLLRLARGLTTGGAALSLVGRRSRVASALSGAAYVAGSVLTRFGVFEAGIASAKDPKYIVVPQKARLNNGR